MTAIRVSGGKRQLIKAVLEAAGAKVLVVIVYEHRDGHTTTLRFPRGLPQERAVALASRIRHANAGTYN